MEQVEKILKGVIDENGVDYPGKCPYEVYEKLIESGVDGFNARLILVSLVAGAAEKAGVVSVPELSKYIQAESGLMKKYSDKLAAMYASLFDTENMSQWGDRKECGLRDFCSKSWKFEWSGDSVWTYSTGHIECYARVKAELKSANKAKVRKFVRGELKENPFLSADKIFEKIRKKLRDVMEIDLDDYVTEDDYYEPVMDDYYMSAEYALEKGCEEIGLKILSFDCDGSDSGYEPDFYRHRGRL